MNPDALGPLSADLEFDAFLYAFETSGRTGPEALADFLPPPGDPRREAVLTELVRIDLERAWDRGERPDLSGYLDRFPALRDDPERLRGLVSEDHRLRLAAGVDPLVADDSHEAGLDSTQPGGHTTSSAAGTGVGGFEVVGELGEGSFGRVYLARDPGLAGRLVVLKVSPRLPLEEAQTLARLQHTNIVPVYTASRQGEDQLICMPYLGAVTLDRVLARLRSGPRPRSGIDLLRAIDLPPSAERHAPREALARLGFVDAVLWVGSQLADGLAHAHERGVVHRDVKPANVLISDEGRPMLLDFNLAHDTGSSAREAFTGGTPAYMAPEQLRSAFGRPEPVGPPADVYALGLLLYEMLTGGPAFAAPPGPLADTALALQRAREAGAPDVRRGRPDASPAVAAIVAKCLDPDPRRRYADGAQLREDLLRQLESRPLRHAPDRSPRERVRKWARRHPLAAGVLGAGTLAALLAAVTFVVLDPWRHRLRLLEGRAAVAALRETRDSVRPAIFSPDATADAQEVRERLAEALRPFGGGVPSGLLWEALPPGEREEAGEVAGELLAYDAECLARLGRLDEALECNRLAALSFPGADGPLTLQRDRLLKAAGRGPGPARPRQMTGHPSEVYLEAMQRLREGDAAGAAELLTELVGRPDTSFSAWAALGDARMRLDDAAGSLRAFDAAVGLAPRHPWLRHARAICLLELGRLDDARADLDAYLRQRPDDPLGLLHRAQCEVRAGRTAAALADLDRLEAAGHDSTRMYLVRAEAHTRAGDEAAARRAREAGLRSKPKNKWDYCARGEARLEAMPPDPSGALADFDAALAEDPGFRPAGQNKANVLSESLGRPADAVAALDAVLRHHPRSGPALAGRAVLLGRLGRKPEARAAAEVCLRHDGSPLTLYQAGCARLLAGDRAAALDLLRRALRGNPSLARLMTTDEDLRMIQGDPTFNELLHAARRLDG